MTASLIPRDRADVRVESTRASFAPVGDVRMVTRAEAHVLIVLGVARMAKPERGEYNRSDMQAEKHARTRSAT